MKLNRIVLHGAQARTKLAKGADYLADCVKGTLGPFGHNFFLDKRNAITNDGVKIAQEIVLDDEVENRGAIALREAAVKTNDQVGDGTTSAITLAQAIYRTASKKLQAPGEVGGMPPVDIVRQIEKEKNEIVEKLAKKAQPITTEAELINSAIVSVEDQELGEIIAKVQWELGADGYIIAEETAEKKCSVERILGIRTDNGVGSSLVINNIEKQQLEVDDVHVILTNHTIKDLSALVGKNNDGVLHKLIAMGTKGVVIVARAFTSDAIKAMEHNSNKPGGLKMYPINAPYVDQAEIFRDLQAVVGGTYYHDEATNLEDMQLSDIGLAKRITARRWDTTFIGYFTEESQKRVEKRISELTEKHKGSNSDFEKRNILARIAQLKSGFGLVKVGANSDLERKRLFDKCEDAVQAVRAALQEGVVAGAGVAFKEISDELPDTYILKKPLLSIYEQIRSNAPKDWVMEDWVKDPVKVLRIALTNACGAAATFATAGGVITAKNPEKLGDLLKVRQDQTEDED